jgi:hypothetical protein
MRPKELEDKIAARQGRIAPELLFHVLKVTIRPVSHRQWTSGDTPAQTPVRQACHIAGACDGYATGDRDICERHFGLPVCNFDQEIPADQLPTTEQVLAYIEVVRRHVADWLGDMSNETLLGPRPSPGWSQRGWTMLGHVTYVLRHATLHLGYLRAELGARGIKLGVFK